MYMITRVLLTIITMTSMYSMYKKSQYAMIREKATDHRSAPKNYYEIGWVYINFMMVI